MVKISIDKTPFSRLMDLGSLIRPSSIFGREERLFVISSLLALARALTEEEEEDHSSPINTIIYSIKS